MIIPLVDKIVLKYLTGISKYLDVKCRRERGRDSVRSFFTMLIQYNKYELSSPPPRPSGFAHAYHGAHSVIKSCAHQKNLRTTPVFAEKNESIQCRLESGTSILLSELNAISL